jgi:uncharacterized lipoprotein YehR (DUF1307 family)
MIYCYRIIGREYYSECGFDSREDAEKKLSEMARNFRNVKSKEIFIKRKKSIEEIIRKEP